MNKEETKEKLLKFCQGLHNEGLLSNEELKECSLTFNNTSQLSDLKSVIPQLNDNLKNFGMSPEQSLEQDILTLGNNNIINCRLVSYQYSRNRDEENKKEKLTLFSTVETDTTSRTLYLKKLNNLDDKHNSNYDNQILENIIFKLEKNNQGLYTIRNTSSNELLKVNLDKHVIIDGTNHTDNALFNIVNYGNGNSNSFRIESHVFPGFYLNAENPLTITDGSRATHNWKIEIINNEDDLEKINDDTFNASYTRQLINNYLTNYEAGRFNYILMNAKIKFIDLLKARVRNIVSNNGSIMNYLRNRVRNKELDLSESKLMILSANINNEIVNNELEILNHIQTLIKADNKDIIHDINSNTNTIIKINKLIDTAIESKKTELATLNQLLDKINDETRNLNEKDAQIKVVLETKEDLEERSTHNNNTINNLIKQENINYKVIIGLYVFVGVMILYLGYKLYNKIQKEL